MADEADDIDADIAAAFRGVSDGSDAASAAPAAAAAPSEPQAPPAAATGGQPRDATGKFAAKGGDANNPGAQEAFAAIAGGNANLSTDQPAAAATEAQGEPIRPPAAWSAQAKAKFATLDPEVQAEIAKRERDMDKGLSERASQLKRYEPLEQVIAPHRNRLAMNGVTEDQYVRSLIAADEMLRGPNPHQALAQIAQMYGVNLGQAGQPGQQPQSAQLPPEYQALAQTVAQLQQAFTQQQGAQQQAENARTQAEIDAFAKDNMYFENVKPQMIGLLQAGLADNLADAYRQACWARDDIRPLMLQEQEAKRQTAAAEAARAKANDARQASGSITGSPTPGAAPPPANTNGSIEDDVAAVWRAASQRA